MKNIIIFAMTLLFSSFAYAHDDYNAWGYSKHYHHHHHRHGYPEVRYYQPAPPVVYYPQPTFQLQYTPPNYGVQQPNGYYQQPAQPHYNQRSHW